MAYRPPTESILRSAGVRPTTRRIAIFDALAALAAPVSAEELHAEVKTDLVTVYRTLQGFAHAGLVREVRFRDTTVRYELAEDAHHHHLVCSGCGRVDELPHCDLRAIEDAVLRSAKRFASVDEHSLEFFGTCTSCAKR